MRGHLITHSSQTDKRVSDSYVSQKTSTNEWTPPRLQDDLYPLNGGEDVSICPSIRDWHESSNRQATKQGGTKWIEKDGNN